MQISLNPGTYVVAVSGGVDSMSLLHALVQKPGIKLVVAHYDHGIREDSHLDRKNVEQIAKAYKLPFTFAKGKLGANASEETARNARYDFLKSVQKASSARGIITAHHEDDLVETALLNMMRGTGRRGLSSLKSTDGIIRPLLKYPKERILDYAHNNKIAWREDTTNQDLKYRRNQVRQNIVSKLTQGERAQFTILLENLAELNNTIDAELINMLHTQQSLNELDRNWFILLPHEISKEVLHHWLTRAGVKDLKRRRIEQLVVALKTAKPNTVHEVSKKHKIHISKTKVKLKT